MTPPKSPEARLIAFVDGELSPTEHAVFEAELSRNPALAAEVERHRAVAARVAAIYEPILVELVPLRLVAAATAANDRSAAWMGLRQWAAMAACLVVGVAAGRLLWPVSGPLTPRDGHLVARGGLDRALTTQLAADAGPVRVGLSLRDREGRYCRTFQSAADSLAGLACRDGGRWVVPVTAAWTPRAQPDYRTASSDTSPAVLAAVDAMNAGGTLDAAAERVARDAGWASKAAPQR